jgi:hypothetical protein
MERTHETALAQEAAALRTQLQKIEPAPASLLGHVDELEIKDGILSIGGWVLNEEGYFDPPYLFLFYNDEYVAGMRPDQIRSDVLKAFGIKWLPLKPGFRFKTPAKCVPSGQAILIARFEPDNYRRLESPPTPKGC